MNLSNLESHLVVVGSELYVMLPFFVGVLGGLLDVSILHLELVYLVEPLVIEGCIHGLMQLILHGCSLLRMQESH